MKESPWGPNPEWGSKKRPPLNRSGDGEEPSCASVIAPIGFVIGTLIAWMLRRR